MRDKRRKFTTPGSEPAPPEAAELPERWSAQRKTELVLRLLRGDSVDAVSRESQIPAHELESWKRVFLENGARGSKTTRNDPEERELTLARAKIGELMCGWSCPNTSSKKGAHGRVEEAAAMRHAVSPGTGRHYPLTMICAVFRVPRSTVYLMLAPAPTLLTPVVAAKHGPKTRTSDTEVVG